jgi:2-keto-4-pentenoate hydratase
VSVTDVEGKARALFEARRDRKPIEPFTDADPTLGMADGYAVQAALTRLLLEGGDTIVGYKVGLTSAAMQKMIGIDSPDYGPVLGSTVYRDGDTIPLDAFIAPKVEAEIVYVMRDRLAGPGVTLEAAQAAVEGIAASVEIVDSRFVDWRIKLADTVADLASNGAVAMSTQVVPLDDIDAREIAMTLFRNGEQIERGRGSAALGNPLAVVAWLADVLGENDIALEPGHLVMTGALHAAVPMKSGDEFRAEFDRLGAVTVHVD